MLGYLARHGAEIVAAARYVEGARRYDAIQKEAVARAQQAIQRLAEKESVEPSFEVLPETDVERLRTFLGSSGNVLVAPAFLSSRPVYAVLSQFDCTILLVEVPEEQDEPGGPSADDRPTQTR